MIGDIAPKFSAVVKLTNNALVSIEVARESDPYVFADLVELTKHPAISMCTGNLFYIKDSYDPKEVAEAISKCFELKHGFEVRRMLSDSKSSYKDVHCFTEVK